MEYLLPAIPDYFSFPRLMWSFPLVVPGNPGYILKNFPFYIVTICIHVLPPLDYKLLKDEDYSVFLYLVWNLAHVPHWVDVYLLNYSAWVARQSVLQKHLTYLLISRTKLQKSLLHGILWNSPIGESSSIPYSWLLPNIWTRVVTMFKKESSDISNNSKLNDLGNCITQKLFQQKWRN